MQTDSISKPLHSKCSCMVCCIGQIIDLDLSCLYRPLTCAPFRPFCRSWPRLTLWVRSRCPTLKVSEKTPKWYFGISYLQKPSLLYKFQHLPKMFPTTKVHRRYRWPTACITRIVSVPLQQHELPWNALMEIHELRSGIQPEETSPMAKLRKPLNVWAKPKMSINEL